MHPMKRSSVSIARDTLLLLPRLLGASGQVLLQQWFRQPSEQLRKLTSPDWLAAQLGIDSDLLASATIEEVHSGTASRLRLHIRYADPMEPAPGPPSLFIKSRPPDFASNLFGALLDLGGNEVAFYRHIRPELPVRAPEVVYCEGDSGNYMMLLEDLAEAG